MSNNSDILEGIGRNHQSRIALSGILNDDPKVEILRKLTPESRRVVLVQHAIWKRDWDVALQAAEYRGATDEPPQREEDGGTDEDLCIPENLDEAAENGDENPSRLVQRWRRDALRPNEYNEKLFPDSLSEPSIKILAEQIKEDGRQRVPIEIAPDGVILDGHRRWLALAYLGWEMVDVVVVPGVTGDAILDYVINAYGSVRKRYLREQYLVFAATVERLQATLGRKHGQKTFGIPNVLSIQEIRALAKDKAGLDSVDQALKLKKLFEVGTPEQQEAVVSGQLSLTAAYDALPKREKAKPLPRASESSSYDDEQRDTKSEAEPIEAAVESTGSSEEESDAWTSNSNGPKADTYLDEPIEADGYEKGQSEPTEAPMVHDGAEDSGAAEPEAGSAEDGIATDGVSSSAGTVEEALDASRITVETLIEKIDLIIDPVPGNPFTEPTVEELIEKAQKLYKRWEGYLDLTRGIKRTLGVKRSSEILDAIKSLQQEPGPEDLLSAVPSAIAGMRDASSYEEARERCEALVGEIWEALGEAPEEGATAADDDELSFLALC